VDPSDPVKQRKAKTVLRRLRGAPTNALLLCQVIGEFMRFLRAWRDQGQISHPVFRRYYASARGHFRLALATAAVLDLALDLADRFSLSHGDSMLLAACIEAGVDTLYTEDMGAPVQIDSVNLINPFV